MPQRTSPLSLSPALLCAALFWAGCPHADLAPLEPCTVSGVKEDISRSGVDQVDVLFVIDNSQSMAEEQQKILEELPRLVDILVTGDVARDGDNFNVAKGDFEPVSLHLGVVSSDMGTSGGPKGTPTCGRNERFGDDGLLISTCDGERADTDYQRFDPKDSSSEIEAKVERFGCVANLGLKGCAVEQQLEAMWKALAPSSDHSFGRGTAGHGDAENAGFLRKDAILAVIHVSDEEDCSVTEEGTELMLFPDDDIPKPRPAIDAIGFNYRCAHFAEDEALVQPIERYRKGLLSLKRGFEERVIFAGIVGVPTEAENWTVRSDAGEVQDFDRILAAPEMELKAVAFDDSADPDAAIIDPTDVHLQPFPKPACYASDGTASPARRFVKLAKEFGENGVIRSICQEDYASALEVIIRKISKQLTGACLPRALMVNEQGLVECEVVELLPEGETECDPARGRRPHPTLSGRTDENGARHTVCQINQVAVVNGKPSANPDPLPGTTGEVGWYYDTRSDEVQACPKGKRQRIAFYPEQSAGLSRGATASFECFSQVGGSANDRGEAAVGSPCRPGADECSERGDTRYDLACESLSRTCQITCEGEQLCPLGWACEALSEGGQRYCINAVCPPLPAGE